jgi:hypothetical protein
MLISVFFTGEISPKGDFFLPLAYLWRNLNPKKTFLLPKIHPFWPFDIHLNPFSSAFRAFIQHPDELASGYVLVVPPKRKTKNHRKNTDAHWQSSLLRHPILCISLSTTKTRPFSAYAATSTLELVQNYTRYHAIHFIVSNFVWWTLCMVKHFF